MRPSGWWSAGLAALLAAGGCVQPRCFDRGDCPEGKICDPSGRCVLECRESTDCWPGLRCVEHRCEPEPAGIDAASDAAGGPTLDGSPGPTPDGPGGCPPEMARAGDACLDRWEASHADATATAQGSSPVAASRPGVLPWFPATHAAARAACAAGGKRLCSTAEWVRACEGPARSAYAYGDAYDPAACNGIDAFCRCDAPACSALAECPYPHCYGQAAPGGGGPCGADFRAMPTGSFPGCESAEGAFDLNGNLWEAVDSTDGLDHVRGGAFNCGDSEALHRCDYDATWTPPAKGFRCCLDAP